MAWARTRGERVSAGAGGGAGWRWGTGGWGALTAEDVHKMCEDVHKLPPKMFAKMFTNCPKMFAKVYTNCAIDVAFVTDHTTR